MLLDFIHVSVQHWQEWIGSLNANLSRLRLLGSILRSTRDSIADTTLHILVSKELTIELAHRIIPNPSLHGQDGTLHLDNPDFCHLLPEQRNAAVYCALLSSSAVLFLGSIYAVLLDPKGETQWAVRGRSAHLRQGCTPLPGIHCSTVLLRLFSLPSWVSLVLLCPHADRLLSFQVDFSELARPFSVPSAPLCNRGGPGCMLLGRETWWRRFARRGRRWPIEASAAA